MNCQRFRELWTEWHAGTLDPELADACREERYRCARCARYDRNMRLLVDELAGLPLPDATESSQSAAPVHWQRTAQRPVSVAKRCAAAAVILLALTAVVLAWHIRDDTASPPVSQSLETLVVATGNDIRHVHVSLAAKREFESVEFVIELPRGVELDGFPGERVVSWSGRLPEGRSRLTLPLRVEAGVDPDEVLVARVRHPGGSYELHVRLQPAGGASARVQRSDA